MQYFGNKFLLLLYLSSCLVLTTSFKRHKTRHTWEKRHKRQGARVYLPGSFVTSGGEGVDRGPWSPWSEPTQCSRPCGGGVSTQQRYCIEPNACTGPTSMYFSCNTQDCRTQDDFRAKQCSEFDTVPFEGIYYQWVPYTKAPNKCELNCMPKGERFYYRHKMQVVDGTRCDDEKLDVCVQGVCQHVGCDRNLGSNATEDKCRECGGGGTSCDTIQGDLDMTDLQTGYNDILLIPNGAVNVVVEEKSPSNNYLAIRNTSGHYYLNGNWRIDFPKSLNFAGTVFHYERTPQGFSAPDRLSCLGPTTEPLYIVLLSQDTNVGVRYEYSVSKGSTKVSAEDVYSWTYEEFSPCSARCGGGYQTRRVTCINQISLDIAERHLCDNSAMPSMNQTCGTDACEAHWIEGPWSECSSLCGNDGVKTRQVYCEQIVSNNVPSIVPDELCLQIYPKKPDTQLSCNNGFDCPKWFVEPWKACDQLCGEGKQTRKVVCYRKIKNRIDILPDWACERVEPKPEIEKKCFLEPCQGVDWITSEWSGCEKCGLVNETRTVQCATQEGEVYPDNLCDSNRIPKLLRTCDQTTQCDFEWYASQWTECSAKCGNGIQSRKVFCISLEDDVFKKVTDDKCKSELKYSDVQNCTIDGDCPGEWYSGPWSKCTKNCGGGEKTRKVMCIKNNQTVDVSQCESGEILFASDQCNTHACDKDEIIGMSTTMSPEVTETDTNQDDCEEEIDEDYDDDTDQNFDEDIELTTTVSDQTTEIGSTNIMSSFASSLSDEDLMLSDSVIDEITFTAMSGDGSGTTEFETMQTDATPKMDTTQQTTEMYSEDITLSTLYTTDSSTEMSTENTFSTAITTEDSVTGTDQVFTTTNDYSITTDDLESSTTTDSSTETTIFTTTSDSTTTDLTMTTESETTTILTTLETIVSTISSTMSDLLSTTTDSDLKTTISEEITTNMPTTDTEGYSSLETSTPIGTTISETDTSVTTDDTWSTLSESTEDATVVTDTTTSTMETTSEAVSEMGTEITMTTDINISTDVTTEMGTDMTTEMGSDMTTEMYTDMSTSTDYEVWSTEQSTPYTIEEILTTRRPKKCKPRRQKTAECKISEFGCCNDGKTKATGPFHKGCPIFKTCNETKYGCCSDNVSPAKGPKGKGCPRVNCKDTLYGCCPDKKSVADGNDYLGCKKEVPKPKCASSKYGCCDDNSTAAKGPNYKGCKKDECSDSEFGCCSNSTKKATGPNNQGCEDIIKKNCTSSTYGCCSDNETPAHGPNREGCCLQTAYGCCPDNYQAARGPNYQDCSCHYSLYGCCNDNKTSAKGPEQEGCTCKNTEFGCCPDQLTIAKGPEYDGCPCSAFQFGCCPDGIKAATGPHNQGCGCKYSEFGCCPDETTTAKGSNFTGCDCSTSKYKCCIDGVTEAQGNDFEGCKDVPVNAQDVCKLEKDTGSCKNYSVKWYFDMQYGGCSRFWYGGCDGNGNRFETDTECRQTCIEPQGKDVCSLPSVPGPCEGYYPMWYFDNERKQCSQFIYRGCLGNNNKFEKREQCEETCPVQNNVEPCNQVMDEGPCQGNFSRWFFDKDSQTCEPFKYGGCKGTSNNYMTEESCKYQCLNPNKQKDFCQSAKSEGNCTGRQAKWYFNRDENRCMPFYYTGCGAANKNQFNSLQACDASCPSRLGTNHFKKERNICSLPAVLGDCRDYTTRWYYDTKDKRCRQFYYGGCNGNENNFETEDKCLKRCESQSESEREQSPVSSTRQEPPQEFKKEHCFLSPQSGNCRESHTKWFFDRQSGTCRNFNYSGCGGNANQFNSVEECYYYCVSDTCSLPVDPGTCDEYSTKWYYDSRSRRCEIFQYGGCDGNQNRFDSEQSCNQRCQVSETRISDKKSEAQPERTDERIMTSEDVSLCYEPLEKGNCSGSTEMWHFDINERKCIPFEYSGCGGNRNQFRSVEQCERHCGIYRGLDVCRIRGFDTGPCRSSLTKFYYDITVGKCQEFIYGGCDGNGNRFSSMEECEQLCTRNHDTDNEIDQRLSCDEIQRECQRMDCPYGIEKFVKNDCEYCKCYNPCEAVICLEGTQCVIEYNEDYEDENDPRFTTECKPTIKDGHCPSFIHDNRNCSRDCNTDADCRSSMKCCRTGCGSVCLEPEVQAIRKPDNAYPTSYVTEAYQPQSQYFEDAEDEVKAEEGGYATFKCVVKSQYRNPKIVWRKNDLVIDGSLPRYRLRLDGSLQIVNLYKTDSGVYICVADIGEQNPVHKEFKLEISEPTPRSAAVLGEDDNRLTITLGQPTSVQCYAYGWPRPFITWWRNDNMLPLLSDQYEQRSDYSLFISSVKLSNLGIYTCQAYNGLGKAASWSVTVQTFGPVTSYDSKDSDYLRYVIDSAPVTQQNVIISLPDPRRNQEDNEKSSYTYPVHTNITLSRYSYREEEDITIPCHVEGHPIPRVTWFKNNEPLQSNASIQITESNKLVILKANASDSGSYKCEADNGYSKAESTISVIVEGIYVHPNCTDNQFFANCRLIVQAKYCTHKYYAKFCCRSCTKAGQLPSYGTHLSPYSGHVPS